MISLQVGDYVEFVTYDSAWTPSPIGAPTGDGARSPSWRSATRISLGDLAMVQARVTVGNLNCGFAKQRRGKHKKYVEEEIERIG